jgi:hypothetical protein
LWLVVGVVEVETQEAVEGLEDLGRERLFR